MKPFALAVVLLVPASACADELDAFVGAWIGKGTYILSGDLYQCSLMKMVFSKTKDEFSFDYGRRECDKHSENFDRVVLNYHDGGFFYPVGDGKEAKAGEYGDGKVELHFDMPDPKGGIRHWRMSMRAEGNNFMYEERRIMDENVTPLISFAGLGLKQP
jgi:hypothetical protein